MDYGLFVNNHLLYRNKWRLTAISLVLLAFLMRVFRLNDVAVEKAEMTNIMWFIREGFTAVVTQNKALNNHPLNSVLGYATSALGVESLFTLRWHSVVIGVLTVALAIRVARDWLGRREALVAGLLITTSAFHVTVSQRARSYVGLVGFTLLGFYFGYRAVQTGKWRYWVGFALAGVLNIYAHLYGAMAVGVLGLLLIALLLEKYRRQRVSLLRMFGPFLVSGAALYLIALALYLPMWSDTVSVAGQANIFRDSDLRQAADRSAIELIYQPIKETIRPFSIADDSTRVRVADPSYHYSPFDPLAVLAENDFGYGLAVLSLALGLIFGRRKLRRHVLLFVAWLAVPFVVQHLGNRLLPGAYFRGRFLSFVYPPFLLLTAAGWPGLGDRLAEQIAPAQRGLRRLAHGVGWAGVWLLVLLNLAWLGTFYSATINENWPQIGTHIAQNLEARDVIVCGQRPKSACTFDVSTRTDTETLEFIDLITPEKLQKNRAGLEQPGRVWLVMPHLLPWQIEALQTQLPTDNLWLAGNPNVDRAGWLLLDAHDTLGDNLVLALELSAAVSLTDLDSFKNYGSLAQLQLFRNRLPDAEAAFAAASRYLPPDDAFATELHAALSEQLAYALSAAAPPSLPDTATRLDKNYGGLARLLAYEIPAHSLAPGHSLPVTLYWQPLAPIGQELVSFAHLTGLDASVLSRQDGVPGNGQTPTTTWQPGQIISDTYTLTAPAEVPPPLALKLEAGLFAPEDFAFVPPLDDSGNQTDALIAKIRVLSPAAPASQPSRPAATNFDNRIALTGFDLQAEPPAIVFYWQALTDIAEDVTLFVHLLNNNGELISQLDGRPFGGSYPTLWWAAGETVVDARPVPAIPAGTYRILAGWYRPADGSRLPLADGSGDSFELGEIEIR